jgi:hypothetical protein
MFLALWPGSAIGGDCNSSTRYRFCDLAEVVLWFTAFELFALLKMGQYRRQVARLALVAERPHGSPEGFIDWPVKVARGEPVDAVRYAA